MRPLQNPTFWAIAASESNFNPRNTQCILAVKVFTMTWSIYTPHSKVFAFGESDSALRKIVLEIK